MLNRICNKIVSKIISIRFLVVREVRESRTSLIYQILEKGFLPLFFVILFGLFLKGEIFRIHTSWISITFTSVKNFGLIFIIWWLALRMKTIPRISIWVWLLLILSVASAVFSIHHIETIKADAVLFIYIFWFFAVKSALKSEKEITYTVIMMLVLSGIINMANLYYHYSVGIGEVIEKYPFWQGKNALGLFLVMALCLAGNLKVNRNYAWLMAISSLLLVLGIIFSYSRGALAAFLVVIAGTALYKIKRAVWIIISAIIILFIFSPSFVTNRFNSILTGEDINVKQRLTVWENTIEIIKDKPAFGTGLGTFTEAYREKYPESAPLKGEESRPIRHAHSLYLQILEETGILGLLIFIMLVIAGLIKGIKYFKAEENPFIKSIRYGSLLGIIVFLVYSITDCTTSWQFIGDSFSHINLIWVLLWALVLTPAPSPRLLPRGK